MFELSLAGLIGAVLGIAVAALVHGRIVDFLDAKLQARHAGAAEDDITLAQERALMRRAAFAFDILLFAGLGYWIGDAVAG